jgi:hypothetical protein
MRAADVMTSEVITVGEDASVQETDPSALDIDQPGTTG